jgi:hypothetical protein
MTTLFEAQAPHPLADPLRQHRLADIVGQDHLLGPEGPIGRMVASRQLASMILWGPPAPAPWLGVEFPFTRLDCCAPQSIPIKGRGKSRQALSLAAYPAMT